MKWTDGILGNRELHHDLQVEVGKDQISSYHLIRYLASQKDILGSSPLNSANSGADAGAKWQKTALIGRYKITGNIGFHFHFT